MAGRAERLGLRAAAQVAEAEHARTELEGPPPHSSTHSDDEPDWEEIWAQAAEKRALARFWGQDDFLDEHLDGNLDDPFEEEAPDPDFDSMTTDYGDGW